MRENRKERKNDRNVKICFFLTALHFSPTNKQTNYFQTFALADLNVDRKERKLNANGK